MIHSEIPVRADPDVLLSAISKKKSKRRGGRLYLHIGMAPGVGKTYAMLLAGHEAKKSGTDVVVGVVETHGRKETEVLVQGLEVIAKKPLVHRDIEFMEMDIDAVLARKPALVLVDELAHSNIPGSRHKKRWQDVLELLDAGIDVFSTMNVQHLESRKDAVEKITKVTISETVPDSVLDRAFQIQLIDISVPNLLRRLKEGKVYLGEKAELAAANFFKEEKLTALREIALRVAAERVDAELQTFATETEAGASQGATDRLMVAVGLGKSAEMLIRTTRRLAYNLDAPWIAVHISTNEMMSEEEKSTLSKNLELARNLGAIIITASDTNLVDALIRIARQKDVTQIIVGRSPKKWFRDLFGRGSIHDQLIQKSTIDVCIIGPKPTQTTSFFERLNDLKIKSSFMSYMKAIFFSGALLGLSAAITPFTGYPPTGFLFLIAILILGLFLSIGPLFLASIISMLGWNFFFIPPIGTLSIKKPEDIFLYVSYLVATLCTGILTRRNKYQRDILINREVRSQALNQILLDLATETTPRGICDAVTKHIVGVIKGKCDVVLVKEDKSLTPFVLQRLEFSNQNREMAVARWVIENNKIAGRFTETLSSAEGLYIPLKGSFDTMGALVYQAKNREALSIEDMDLLFAAAHQIALSLEKQKFRKRALESERLAESERLHQSLLETLVTEVKSTPEFQHSGSLPFMMENFLLASRLSAGIFPLRRESCELLSLVEDAITKVREAHGEPVAITIHGRESAPVAHGERSLLTQAVANIMFSAAQHAPGQEISVQLKPHEIIVSDVGTGVHEQYLDRIFEKPHRAEDGVKSKNTLYLTVAKGVIKAHEGKITLRNQPSGGSKVFITLP